MQRYKTWIIAGALFVVVALGVGYKMLGSRDARLLTPRQDASFSLQRAATSGADSQGSPSKEATYCVFVSGAVKRAGVYELSSGARVINALRAAGGFARSADRAAINLAARIADEQQIYFPKKGESAKSGRIDSQSANSTNGAPSTSHAGTPHENGSESENAGDKVNINTANATALETLEGVGPATAQKIITYREEHGPFSAVDDLKNIDGIGDKKVEAIREGAVAQ